MPKSSIKRLYNFSDAFLSATAHDIAGNISRDMTDMIDRGITVATISAIETDITIMDDIATDGEMRAQITIAVETKTVSRDALIATINGIRTMAENKFGLNSGKYTHFGFDGIASLSDDELVRRSKRVARSANQFAKELESEGYSDNWKNRIHNAINDFSKKIDEKDEAVENRDLKTQERIEQGNKVYKEVLRLSNIGKDVYSQTNEAKYNDYIIYNTTSGEAPVSSDANVKITVKNGAGDPIGGAIISVEELNLTLICDENGTFNMEAVPPGDYTIHFFKPGYALLQMPVSLSASQTFNLNAILQND